MTDFKLNIYVDITNFLDTKLNTGIQRVLKEFLYHAMEDADLNLYIVYFNQDLNKFCLTKKDQYKSLLNSIEISSLDFDITFDIFKETKYKKYFFDLDRVWNSKPNRLELYKDLKKSNFSIINYIYDLIPILYPNYFYEREKNFPIYINAILKYSNKIFFDSKSCQNDFLKYKEEQNILREIPNKVIPLGCDFKLSVKAIQKKYKKLLEKKYILFVGTIEPRKKHAELLEVFEKLYKIYPDLNLVFIGRFGWDMENFKYKVKTHKLLNKSLFHLDDIEDETLVEFYKNAFVVCYLSNYEGFGLPVAESLYFNNITISSKNSSLEEISNNTIYVTSNSELYNLIDLYLKDNRLYKEKKSLIKNEKKLITWNLFYQYFKNDLESFQ